MQAFETMKIHRQEIEQIWADAVRSQIKLASALAEPVLYNYFPTLLQFIEESLNPGFKRDNAIEGNTFAQEHGGERARLTRYSITQVATEFHLIKDAIYRVLDSKIELTKKERTIIDQSIDMALRESITAFALAEAFLREHFIAMLAHDLRSPIGTIRMATSLLLEGVEASVAAEMQQRILDNADSAEKIIRNILDANVIKAGRRFSLAIQKADMRQLIEECRQSYVHDIRIEGNTAIGYWCPAGLKRVLHNLIENGLKYGDSDKPLSIFIEELHGAVRVRVHNEGPPIPVEQQENVFQPFQRASPDKEGWGFGLPIVRGVVESHGGTVTLDSSVERGTTFSLSVPLDARPFQNSPSLDG